MVVTYLQDIDLSKTDLDSKGKAFETFMGSYFRGDFGQYFTPRPIVQFIVDVLDIKSEHKVLDTSCGSGGFLLHALDKIRQQADEFYQKDTVEHYRYWHDFAEKNLFGIEINEQIARTAKMNMIIHDDGHTNVISADGLLDPKTLQNKSGNQHFTYNSFDFIITNPPFGSTVKQTEKAYLHQYNFGNKDVSWLNDQESAVKNRDSQSTEVLFIEQCHNFLKEGGYLAIVIPDGILTNSSLQYVRDKIEQWYKIVAVISMPQTAFAHTGAGVKSSVLFLQKWDKTTTTAYENLKDSLQDEIKNRHDYTKQVKAIHQDKKTTIKTHQGFTGNDDTQDKKEPNKKAIEQTEAFKAWKKEINALFTDKINALKEELNEEYMSLKKRAINKRADTSST